MPAQEKDLREIQGRVYRMLFDTLSIFELLRDHAEFLFGPSADSVRAAIDECLEDLVRNPNNAGLTHPEVLIFRTPLENFQQAGFYGAQLALKERQVVQANQNLRERISDGVRRLVNRPFAKWVNIINNFLGSLAGATGLSEALKELKDCLRDELPDD